MRGFLMRSLPGFALIFAASVAPAAAQSIDVDVELVLAVDVSASMDKEEARFQRLAYIEAIRHPEFVRAISHLPRQRIAVTYVEWSSSDRQSVIVPFREIDGQASAEVFAAMLEAAPVKRGARTSISRAIEFSANLLMWNRFDGDRKVIDISGDSPNLHGGPVTLARDSAVARGVIINGLPIIIRPTEGAGVTVEQYYTACVIGGPGSFMLPASGMAEFAEAVRQKLIREVAGLSQATIIPVSAGPAVDCLMGEKRVAALTRFRRGYWARKFPRDYLDDWYELRRERRRMPTRDPDQTY
jgi:hypothetical protein